MMKADDLVEPDRQAIDLGGRFRMIADAKAQHRRIAEPEREAGDEADLGDVDRVQAPRRIHAIAHGAAGERAGADIVSDRIAGEAGERGDAVRHVVAADRVQREQIVEGQREVAGGDEQHRQHDRLRGLGLQRRDQLVEIELAQHVVEHVAGDRDDGQAEQQAELVEDVLLAKKRNRLADRSQHRQFSTMRAGHARPIHPAFLRSQATIARRFLAECSISASAATGRCTATSDGLTSANASLPTRTLPAKRAPAPLISKRPRRRHKGSVPDISAVNRQNASVRMASSLRSRASGDRQPAVRAARRRSRSPGYRRRT